MDKILDASPKYQWYCSCGSTGHWLAWHKMCKALDNHIKLHERRLQWNETVDFRKQELVEAN
jgi:hypothetical protein